MEQCMWTTRYAQEMIEAKAIFEEDNCCDRRCTPNEHDRAAFAKVLQRNEKLSNGKSLWIENVFERSCFYEEIES
jgi:hypothetical protein